MVLMDADGGGLSEFLAATWSSEWGCGLRFRVGLRV